MAFWFRPGSGGPSGDGAGADSDDKEFGRQGEAVALRFLEGRGYRVLDKNIRTAAGELDIVAMDGDTLVFVEVKSRRGGRFGTPRDAVNAHKRRQLARSALSYMTKKKINGLHCRFDVVGVTVEHGAEPVVELVKDAFELSGGY